MSSVFDGPPQLGPALGFPNPFAHLDKTGAWSGPPLHQRLSSKPAREQPDCPLFQSCPAEIRSQIFSLALLDYEDPAEARQYSKNACWTRPSYSAPRRTDIALLQTCRAVYQETWFLPFTLKQQTHWITSQDRAPPEYRVYNAKRDLRQTVDKIKREHEEKVIGLDSIRFFTQMCNLESVAEFLAQFPDLAFRRVFITIRHTDFWYWEDDEPLRFACHWIPGFCRELPATVREVTIEMETVRRKSTQLDDIAHQMAQRWHFRTKDGEALFADSTAKGHGAEARG
ncbi:hypothetical protein IF1G_06349 [Cordyceps javanica]|uniref:Uncharacterized protein n=1 Tax=Cordyceps javanica TaxID=43265 RepID=A0A545VL89_9HYPO|nr:hypothetical protein IF1G_06349 [Cordyceps javanica]TQW02508.1 hypothetical protein IF2G_09899 [Cordyceps javanica]